MKKLTLLSVALMAMLSSSCAISYKMPDNRFETPEVNSGFGKVTIKAAYGQAKEIELTPDYSTTYIDTSIPAITSKDQIHSGLSLGLIDNLEAGLRYLSDVGVALNFKYQFVGKKSEKGMHMAANISGGGGSESKSEGYSTPSSAKLSNSFIGGDLIFGWRTGRDFMFYTSVFRDEASYKVDQTRAGVNQYFEGESVNTGGTFGIVVNFSNSANIMLEFARAKATSGKSKLTSSAFGAGINIFAF